MQVDGYKLGDWCPLWLRGWVLHYYNDVRHRPRAATIMLHWHYRRTKRQRTFMYSVYAPDGTVLDCGTTMKLGQAKVRVREALRARATPGPR